MTTELPAQSTAAQPAIRRAMLDYLRGPLALVPAITLLLIIQVYTRLGEWRPSQVLALCLGMTGSMLITNGFIQAITRRGSIYLSLGDIRAASHYLRVSMVAAGACVTIAALILMATTAWFNILSASERFTFGLALIGLAAIWLLGAGLSLVQATGWLGIGLAIGLAAGVITDRATALLSEAHLLLGTIVGFSLAFGLMALAVRRKLRSQANGQPGKVVLPPVSFLVYEGAPYFAYGLLYMIFILTPHLLSWYGKTESPQQAAIVVTSVELGLTLSLLPIMLVSGMTEHALRLFWLEARRSQDVTPGADPDRFGWSLRQIYRRQMWRYLISLIVSSAAVFGLFHYLLATGVILSWLQTTQLDEIVYIFTVSLIAYGWLGWGLYNSMFCITLARPQLAVKAVVIGLATLIIAGVPLSFGLNFTQVVVAFVLGAAAFGLASARSVQHLLRAASYYYFTSF